jgi:hypothetical protein
MIDPIKLKLVGELMEHLHHLQAQDLKELLDKSRMPVKEPGEMPLDGTKMADGSDYEDDLEHGSVKAPKGISVEKVEVIGKPAEDAEMVDAASPEKSIEPEEKDLSDDELEELMAKLG